MSKKKDSMRRDAMEVAFQTLYQAGPDADAESLKSTYASVLGQEADGAYADDLGWRLAFGAFEADGSLTAAMDSLSPAWLLEKLDRVDIIIVKLMLYATSWLNLPPKVVVRNLIDIVRWQERALATQVLYSLSFNPAKSIEELKSVFASLANNLDSNERDWDPHGLAWKLAAGVWKNEDVLDEAIKKFSRHWRIDRMGKIELTILRMTLFELFAGMGAPRDILADAVAMAASFGAGNAQNFIGGILEAAAQGGEDCNELRARLKIF